MMAKVAMDIDAKHVKNNIAKWTYDDVKTNLVRLLPYLRCGVLALEWKVI